MNFKSVPLSVILLTFFLNISFPSLAQDMVQGRNTRVSLLNDSLSERQVENLFAFAKVYGYVKYFYPLKKKERINWSYIAAHGTRKVIDATSDVALRDSLIAVFGPIAPLLTVQDKSDAIGPASKEATLTATDATASSSRFYYNLHQGLGQDKDDLPFLTRKISSSLYKSAVMGVEKKAYLNLVAAGTILPVDSLYSAQIAEDLYCSFPIVVTESTFESNNTYRKHHKKYKLDLDLHQDRVATMIIFWNVFQHFYPYLDNTEGWDKVFFQTMHQLSPSMSESDFLRVGKTFMASLKDGHASFSYRNGSGIYKRPTAPPIEVAWVENRLIVSKVNIISTDIQQGDIIDKIDATDAVLLVNQLKAYISYANENNADLLAGEKVLNWLRENKDVINLELTDSDGNKKSVLLGGQDYQFKKEVKITPIRELKDGVYYIDASRINEKDILKNLVVLKQANGIIFDLRARPSSDFLTGVLPYFIKDEVETGNWSIPHYTFPDQKNVNYKKTGKWLIKPNGVFLNANKVFLIGHNTISYGETCAELIDYYKLGTTVGGYTASTNGNINFSGAGKLQVVWTGMKVLKRDGSPYHGVGVKPDILVQPALEDIRLDIDAQLETAVEYLKDH